MESSLSFRGLRAGLDSFAGLEDVRRFFGASDWVSGRFRFFWEEGIVKKEDIVVVCAEVQGWWELGGNWNFLRKCYSAWRGELVLLHEGR
jgi:hypothetical protein